MKRLKETAGTFGALFMIDALISKIPYNQEKLSCFPELTDLMPPTLETFTIQPTTKRFCHTVSSKQVCYSCEI